MEVNHASTGPKLKSDDEKPTLSRGKKGGFGSQLGMNFLGLCTKNSPFSPE